MHADDDTAERGRTRARGGALSGRSLEVLRRVVEQHVVPRLVLSHPHLVREPLDTARTRAHVTEMATLALSSCDEEAETMLSDLKASGAGHDALQLGLLAPAAERLGELWREDQIDMFDVTVGTSSLLRSMRFVSLELDKIEPRRSDGAVALLAPAPGDSHGFGAAMAAEFFRRGGWRVRHLPAPSEADLLAVVRAEHVDMIGLSLTAERNLEGLAQVIDRLKRASRHRNVVVIVGGPVFARDPALVSRVGADAVIAAIDMASAEAHDVIRRLGPLR